MKLESGVLGFKQKGAEWAWLLLPETQPRPTHPRAGKSSPNPDGKYLTLGLL